MAENWWAVKKFTQVRPDDKKTDGVFVLFAARKEWARAMLDHGNFYLRASPCNGVPSSHSAMPPRVVLMS